MMETFKKQIAARSSRPRRSGSYLLSSFFSPRVFIVVTIDLSPCLETESKELEREDIPVSAFRPTGVYEHNRAHSQAMRREAFRVFNKRLLIFTW